jgi:hypothetical protein
MLTASRNGPQKEASESMRSYFPLSAGKINMISAKYLYV